MNADSTRKAGLRSEVLSRRDAESRRDIKSHDAILRLLSLAEYVDAATVLTYIGVGSEVATREFVVRALEEGKRVAAPWVAADGLHGAFIRSLDELAPARFGLLEPDGAARADPGRLCHPAEVDLFVVPGVAFDHHGGRLGHGRAYYDRLLARARPGARFVGLAFECQLVAEVPMTATDVRMHAVTTERAVYRAEGRE